MGPGAARVDQLPAEFQVPGLAGGAVELHQSELDLLVTVVAARARTPRTECRHDHVGVAADDVEQRRLTRGVVMSDTGLDQVTGAVELVGIAEIGEPSAGLATVK